MARRAPTAARPPVNRRGGAVRPKEGRRIQSIERAAAILEYIVSSRDGCGLTALSEAVGLNIHTTASLVRTLVALGYVSQPRKGGDYATGNRLLRLAVKVVADSDIKRIARPHVERLFAQCNETVHLGILLGNLATDIDVIESSRSVRMSISPGHTLPVYCSAVGKVLVAWKEEPEILAILSGTEMRPLTPRTITTRAEFLREMKSVRSAGCALNRGESEDGVRCVSAPIRDSTGQVVAGLSVSSPKERYRAEREKQIVGLVLEACRQISLDLGYDRRT